MDDELRRDWHIYRGGIWYTPDEINEMQDKMPNPNLYLTLTASGYLWSSTVYPWQEVTPWTFNAGI